MESNPKPIPASVALDNFKSRQTGNLAWVEYDQTTTINDGSGQQLKSREKRLLVNDGRTWKIASQVTISSYSVEDQINSVGYRLLSDGKPQEAIELLKANVRLYPESWNVYDSLGEAYAAVGQKDLAIQNYEKSLQLNPKNETGKAALEKLRGK
jgi:tetratricopeptide (TPR) repeat protein